MEKIPRRRKKVSVSREPPRGFLMRRRKNQRIKRTGRRKRRSEGERGRWKDPMKSPRR
jgi:hypothetical protein